MGSEAPFWWTEGGAEFWTHYVGYNDWGSSRDALLRMSVLDPDATLMLFLETTFDAAVEHAKWDLGPIRRRHFAG